jgi:hypothetical protein
MNALKVTALWPRHQLGDAKIAGMMSIPRTLPHGQHTVEPEHRMRHTDFNEGVVCVAVEKAVREEGDDGVYLRLILAIGREYGCRPYRGHVENADSSKARSAQLTLWTKWTHICLCSCLLW